MKNRILTIAIPVYNMEQYLARCLDSVTNIENLDLVEILVINDGSIDNSLIIARSYEARFPNVVKVIDKENGGWGTAINRAIEEATGIYFKSLDSDDCFDSKSLDNFILLLSTIKVDIIFTALSEVNNKGESIDKTFATQFLDRTMLLSEYLKNNNFQTDAPIHALTYSAQLLKENKVRVCEKYYADLDYIITPLIYVNSVYISSLNIYKYFYGREGQSVSIIGYNAHLDDYLTVTKKSIKFFSDNQTNMTIELKKLMLFSLYERIKWGYTLLMSSVYSGKKPGSKHKLRDFDEFIKENNLEIYKLSSQIKYKNIIPYIYIWRKTGINLFVSVQKWRALTLWLSAPLKVL